MVFAQLVTGGCGTIVADSECPLGRFACVHCNYMRFEKCSLIIESNGGAEYYKEVSSIATALKTQGASLSIAINQMVKIEVLKVRPRQIFKSRKTKWHR